MRSLFLAGLLLAGLTATVRPADAADVHGVSDRDMVMSLVPFIVVGIPFAVANYYLAPRLGKSAARWALLSLIPVFNLVFIWYAIYRMAFSVLDRLAELENQKRGPPPRWSP
jgi:hypothetical protein